ncbi:MAG TPA: hypothetical protein VMJ32_11065 [Pirellulales bacterium]|nr:hypothetical protein [Pirellulales bacterium]
MSLILKSLTRIETRPLNPVSQPEPASIDPTPGLIDIQPEPVADQPNATAAILEPAASPPVAVGSPQEIFPLEEIDPLDEIVAPLELAFDQSKANLAVPLAPLPDQIEPLLAEQLSPLPALAEFNLTDPLPLVANWAQPAQAESLPPEHQQPEITHSEPASSSPALPPAERVMPVEQPSTVKPLAVETIAAFTADFQPGSHVDWLHLEQLQNMVTANLANLTASDYDLAEIDLSHIAPAPSTVYPSPPAEVPPPSPAPEVIEWQAEVFRLHAAEVERLQAEVVRLQAEATAPKNTTPSVPAAPEPALPDASLEVPAPPAPTPAVSPANWPGGIPALPSSLEPPQQSQPPLNIRPEFRELRDQLLAKLNLTQHPTLLLVDAGRETGNASWLWPLAAAILDKLNAARGHSNSRILLVEATDADCRLAQTLGFDTHLGLNHVLNNRSTWQAAIQSTLHPQIKLLCRGSEYLQAVSPQRLKESWSELSRQFDLLLVAAGPACKSTSTSNSAATKTSALCTSDLFPLAAAAMLYVELGATSAAAAADAKRLLDAHRIPVLGCVIQPT